jgi:hypothetical protein
MMVAHDRTDGLGAIEDSRQVRRDYFSPVIFFDIGEKGVFRYASIVDKNIDSSHLRQSMPDKSLAIRIVPHIRDAC